MITSGRRSLRKTFGYMYGNIGVVSLTDLLGNFSRSMVFPYVSLYILALGGTTAQIGFVAALAPLAGLLMFPIGGYLADHAPRIRLIVAANLLSVAVVLLYAFAPSWQVFAIAALLQGFAVFQFPARSALIADSLAPGDRGRGIGTMNTFSSGLAIVAPFLAGTIIAIYGAESGMRMLYLMMALVNTANAFINLRFLRETRPAPEKRFTLPDIPGVLRDTYAGIPSMLRRLPLSLKALAGVIILAFMANGVASPYWVVYATEEIGLTPAAWGLILLIEAVLRLAMFMPAGLFVDRWGRTRSLLAALTLSMVVIPLFVFASGFVTALIIRATIALAFATAIPASTALMADTVPRDIRGRVMSAIGQGGIMIGPAGGGTGGPAMGYVITIPLMIASLAGGILYTLNPVYPWVFVLIATLLSIVLVVLFIRDPKEAEV